MSEALRSHLCSDVCRKRGIALGSVQKALSAAMMLEVYQTLIHAESDHVKSEAYGECSRLSSLACFR